MEAYADNLNRQALSAYDAGDAAQANRLASQAAEIKDSGYVPDLFALKNGAQKGGSPLSALVPVGTVVKVLGGAVKMTKGVKGAEAVADAAKVEAEAKIAAEAEAAAKGTGVFVLSRTVFERLRKRIAELRATLPGKIKNEGNMAVAEIDVPGLPKEMAAHSRIDVVDDAQKANGFVGKVEKETFESFKVANKEGSKPYLRDIDTEAKILNNVAEKLGNNRSVSGTINLLTERAPCLSCSSVIRQFEAKYPNIKVTVLDNGGVNIPPVK
jgi:hypothetical protein